MGSFHGLRTNKNLRYSLHLRILVFHAPFVWIPNNKSSVENKNIRKFPEQKITFGKNAEQNITLFYKNNFIRTRESFLLKIKEQIKNNPASAIKQSLKFWVQVVNKTVASASQSAKCILLHAYSRTIASSQLSREQTKASYLILTSWHNSTFGDK